MHEEKRVRALLMEMSIHFVDLACVVGGPIVDLEHVSVVGSPDGRSTVSVTGAARMERCDAFGFDLDLSGTAPRTRLELEFERVACVLDFYPDGFRILPRKPNPLDDAAADARRFADALSQRLRPSRSGVPRRAAPHRAIYLEHLRRLSADGSESPLSLEALAPTMESLYLLAGVVYDDAATVATA